MTKHSDKALKTLEAMGTKPDDWALTPIEWVDELRTVPGWVTCPTCNGGKYVCLDAAGTVLPRPTERLARDEYSTLAHRQARAANKPWGNCPACTRPKRGWGTICTGEVKGLVETMVRVGYPKFPTGTQFVSRFRWSGDYCCHLCAKALKKSGRVPVNTSPPGMTPYGMWVGQDCARKFLALEFKLKKDEMVDERSDGSTNASAVPTGTAM